MTQELREAFEELGLVFLKFGQVHAMRRDLLPAGYAEERESQHDELPAMGIDIVRTTIERDLGAPVAESFASFDDTPWPPPPSPRCTGRPCMTDASWL